MYENLGFTIHVYCVSIFLAYLCISWCTFGYSFYACILCCLYYKRQVDNELQAKMNGPSEPCQHGPLNNHWPISIEVCIKFGYAFYLYPDIYWHGFVMVILNFVNVHPYQNHKVLHTTSLGNLTLKWFNGIFQTTYILNKTISPVYDDNTIFIHPMCDS